MRLLDVKSLTEEEIDDLAVRTVRAIRAERAGVSWDVRSVAGYLGCSTRHVRRLIAAGELEGERAPGSRVWAVPVRSMLAYEDRCYAARAGDGRSPRESVGRRSGEVVGGDAGDGHRVDGARESASLSQRSASGKPT